MATLTRIKVKTQSAGRMAGTIKYVTQAKKTRFNGQWMVSGSNCVARTAFTEMMTTKQNFKKESGNLFFHYVQSFSGKEIITPQQANEIALELAEKLFPDYEALVATHCDTDNLHSHIIVNSVSHKHGKKLHLSPHSLEEQRKVNDQVCMAHGFSVLEPYDIRKKKKGMKPGEYRSALRGESWKFTLIRAIEDALLYSVDRDSFIENMEYEGYEVVWNDSRKYITFITPEGYRCRDRSLHDETYLKENLEKLFAYRQTHNFTSGMYEPDSGWLAQIAPTNAPPVSPVNDVIRLGKELEQGENSKPLPTPFAPTDSKLKRRETLKKLAQGHKLSSEQDQDFELKM